MSLGGFEMDMEDGDLRFKASVPARDEPLTVEACRHLIYVGMSMMDRYLPGLLAVIFGATTPADAIEQCENRRATRDRARRGDGERREDTARRAGPAENIDISDAKMREIFEKI